MIVILSDMHISQKAQPKPNSSLLSTQFQKKKEKKKTLHDVTKGTDT